MVKKNILVICPSRRDRRELEKDFFCKKYNIFFQEYDQSIRENILGRIKKISSGLISPNKMMNQIFELCQYHSIHGIISSDDYPGNIYASVISHELGLHGSNPKSVLICHHKFYSRMMQKEYIPNATPDFRLIDPIKFKQSNFDMSFPIFIKPVKSYLSILADKVLNYSELENVVKRNLPPELFLKELNWFLKKYTSLELNANYLIAEQLLQGIQVTLEGFVFNKKIHIFGVTDTIMSPGTICMIRFDYPSHLPNSIQNRMEDITRKFVEGIGLNNTLFNIEFMYNPKTEEIYIIEINPRISSQFADLYEKVDGFNTYETMIEIALGHQPKITKREGKHQIASSFVLRTFKDHYMKKLPTQSEIDKFHGIFPDARIEIFVKEGMKLSHVEQDGKSFRYALIHLGANNKEELFQKFNLSKQILEFRLI